MKDEFLVLRADTPIVGLSASGFDVLDQLLSMGNGLTRAGGRRCHELFPTTKPLMR
jgi:hypothetical protein